MVCSMSQKRLCGKESCITCYSRSFANHQRAACWSEKNEMKPYEVLRSSNKLYLFTCPDCNHEINIALNRIISGGWCKYCNHGCLCEDESCLFCFQQSFASHPMADLWSPTNALSARQVSRGNDNKFIFDCRDCHHSYAVTIYSIKHDKHCPYCSNQKLCEKDDCTLCFEKSCASHPIHRAWSPENELQPRQVFLQSNKKMKFTCLVCKHPYETKVNHYYNRGGSCPYCSNKYLCVEEDCRSCFQKSFASHPQIHCWSTKNKQHPRTMFKGSEKVGIFDCDICHSEFSSRLYNVLTGYWCPYCKKKTEAKVLAFLKNEEGEWSTQNRFEWGRFSKNNHFMPFDFVSLSKKMMIEVDGAQHFTQVSNWSSPESVQVKDIEKIQKCVREGFSIIHIHQVDIWNDTYDWKTVLRREIKYLSELTPQCRMISRNPVYHSHISKLAESPDIILSEIFE